MTYSRVPEKIRISIGSAIVLGLLKGRLDTKPTTIYLLMCRNEKCSANCGFCPQASNSKAKANMLSRVTWPTFKTNNLIKKIERTAKAGIIKRICIQSLNYPEVFDDILFFVKEVRSKISIPISVSSKPINYQEMKKWADVGIDRVSIALDGATKNIFDRVKGQHINGPYRWENQFGALEDALKVFGEGSVNTHLIVGLGETEKELCKIIQECVDIGVYPGLFAFTPVPGTILENVSPPTISSYRRAQVIQYLLTSKKVRFENMEFDKEGKIADFGVNNEIILVAINSGKPFLTSGCPGCNRPYYNERAGGPFYNYPRQLLPEEIKEAKRLLNI